MNDISTPPELAKTFKHIPKPKEHWLKGSLGLFLPEEFHLYLAKLSKDLGSIYKIHFLGKAIVVVSDSDTVGHILKSRPEQFRRVSQIETVFKELGVHGVFSADGDDWRRQRKLLNPAFKPSQVKKFYPGLRDITEGLCRVMKNQGEFDFQKLIQRYTVDMTTMLAFGYDLNTLDNPDSELQKSLDVVFPRISERLKAPIPYWRWFKLKADREVESALAKIGESVNLFIDVAEKRLAAGKEPTNILEALLLESQNQREDIFGNAITLLLAGEDTTANTLSWAIYYLASHPELQELAWNEIEKNYPQGRKLDWDDLDNFPYVFGAIQESMRLKPVAPFLYLEPKEDVVIEGYEVPKGTMITALLSANNHVSELFNNPSAFDPSRWLDIDDETRKTHSSKLFPFGAGGRLCPGMQLSFVEMKLALIEMLRHFRFERPKDAGEVRESFEFTVRPKNLIVRAITRTPESDDLQVDPPVSEALKESATDAVI